MTQALDALRTDNIHNSTTEPNTRRWCWPCHNRNESCLNTTYMKRWTLSTWRQFKCAPINADANKCIPNTICIIIQDGISNSCLFLQSWYNFILHPSVAYRRGVWGVQPPLPPKLRRPSKIVPNSTRLWKLLKIAKFRTPAPQDVRKRQ